MVRPAAMIPAQMISHPASRACEGGTSLFSYSSMRR